MIGSLAHAEVPSLDAEGFARLRRLDDYCRGQAQVAPAAILRGVVELSLRVVGPSRPLLVAWADALARRARRTVLEVARPGPVDAGLLRAAASAFAAAAAAAAAASADEEARVGDAVRLAALEPAAAPPRPRWVGIPRRDAGSGSTRALASELEDWVGILQSAAAAHGLPN